MDRTGALSGFYEEQVRYALRLIADGKHEAFLWDGRDKGTTDTFATPSGNSTAPKRRRHLWWPRSRKGISMYLPGSFSFNALRCNRCFGNDAKKGDIPCLIQTPFLVLPTRRPIQSPLQIGDLGGTPLHFDCEIDAGYSTHIQ